MNEPWKESLGGRVRDLRRARGLTLKALGERSGLSVRFLSEVEGGRANPSLGSLRELAAALDTDLLVLLSEERSGAHTELLALVRALDPAAAVEALKLLSEARLDARAPPIALLGLRGAGKSSVGERLAARLSRPFLELDRLIEREAGMDLSDLFELYGEERVRQLEGRVLERVLERDEPAVLATGGGLVTHEESWAKLHSSALTIWLKATPQEHWDRVIAQGDLRPMANRSRARAELESLYEARAPLYARAHLIVETSALDVEEVAARVVALIGGGTDSRVPESHGPESHGPESHGPESHGPESHGPESAAEKTA